MLIFPPFEIKKKQNRNNKNQAPLISPCKVVTGEILPCSTKLSGPSAVAHSFPGPITEVLDVLLL